MDGIVIIWRLERFNLGFAFKMPQNADLGRKSTGKRKVSAL
jgi:hypothetical protein